MCIIVAKPRGQEVPSEEILRQCFTRNKDGAGLMYEYDNKIWVDKGYMTFYDFKNRLNELVALDIITKERNLVMHFRIATEGSVRKGTCHPFPISPSITMLNKEKFTTDIAMTHNGIIPIEVLTDDFSDTQEFIRRVLSKPNVKKGLKEQTSDAHSVIKDGGGISKFCLLTPEGMVRLGGNWETEGGVHYSNSTYKVYTPVKNYQAGCGYRNYYYSEEADFREYIDEIVDDYWKEVVNNGFDHWGAVDEVTKKYKDKLSVSYRGRRNYGFGY